jgi:hypothetical protein
MRVRGLVSLVSLAAAAVVSWSFAAGAQPPPPAEPPPPPPPGQAAPAEPPPPPAAAPAGAQSSFVSLGGDWKFGFHGIVGSSFYVQDNATYVFNGQGPLLALAKGNGDFTTGADVRQSRFNFSLAGPKVFSGATPKAVVEIDFFGGYGAGGYGEVSIFPRLRLAYAELNWGNDVIRFGQDHELILGMIPEGMGHMAFPVTYFNGMIGWREPGIGYFHTIPMGEGSKLELALQVIKSDWQNPADFGTNNLAYLNVDLGQLSGYPGFEGRVKYSSDLITAYVAGHYNKVMGTHAGDVVAGPGTPGNPLMGVPTQNIDVWAAVAGVKLQASGLVIAANAYYGTNLGAFLGEQLQFAIGPNDVHEFGVWGEAGYNFSKNFNAYIIGGTSQPDKTDSQKDGNTRLNSSVVGGMVRYQDGGFAVGPEFYHTIANSLDPMTGNTTEIDANQFMLSGMYFF